MSHISKLSIKNYRGIKELLQEFGDEKFIVLIGRGDSGKTTILSAIYAALSPSWNMAFSDLDFYNQDTTRPIEIELEIKELPIELLREQNFGLYIQNELTDNANDENLFVVVKLTVDSTLEPHWVVKAREDTDIDDKPISAADRALLSVNFITDYTDNQFAYNRQSPLYALTKANLKNENTIERIKSDIIRSMANSIRPKQLQSLNSPLGNLKSTAEKLGLKVGNLYAQMDIKDNPYTGNSIALHSENLPYRLHGKGSKRLMSIAIQSELTRQGGIVLVDELEQGLEPDRIVTLVRILKETAKGQVFITTHSVNVVLEAKWNNLFVVNKHAMTLCRTNEDLDACRRSNPQAFFAKKIICCEGKTEQGFLRTIDEWILENKSTNFSAKGIATVNAGGGNKMYTFARKLKALGYDVCVFADDDRARELEVEKDKTIEDGISLFLCEQGNCFERQLVNDLPWEYISDITNCSQNDFPEIHIRLSKDFAERMNGALDEQSKANIRNEIVELSIKKDKEWFKHIPGGEFLGTIFIKAYEDMDDKGIKQNVIKLLKWCNIEI